jgi:hypothetical protein
MSASGRSPPSSPRLPPNSSSAAVRWPETGAAVHDAGTASTPQTVSGNGVRGNLAPPMASGRGSFSSAGDAYGGVRRRADVCYCAAGGACRRPSSRVIPRRPSSCSPGRSRCCPRRASDAEGARHKSRSLALSLALTKSLSPAIVPLSWWAVLGFEPVTSSVSAKSWHRRTSYGATQ